MKKVVGFLLLAALAFLIAPTAHAQSHSVAMSWTAPTGTPAATGYFVYRANGACANGIVFTQLNTAAITTLTYTDSSSTLATNGVYCYQVTATDAAGIQSIPSNQVAATIPGPSAAPTGLVITSVN